MWGAEHTRFSLDENLKAQKQSPDPLHNEKNIRNICIRNQDVLTPSNARSLFPWN